MLIKVNILLSEAHYTGPVKAQTDDTLEDYIGKELWTQVWGRAIRPTQNDLRAQTRLDFYHAYYPIMESRSY